MKDTNMHGLDYSMVAFFVQKTVLLLSSFRELVFRVSTDSDRQRGKREREISWENVVNLKIRTSRLFFF